MLPSKSTGDLQPLNLSIFGQLKLKYRKWLSEEMVLRKDGNKNLTEQAVKKFVKIFKGHTKEQINYGFRETKNSKISDRKC